jgi:hypothetical protein
MLTTHSVRAWPRVGGFGGNGSALLGVTLAVVIGALGLAACVADAAPIMGDAIAGDGEVTLHWAAPPADNGELIVKYVVIPYVGGVEQASRTFDSNATTQYVTGLTNDTTYTFVVYGINHLGHATARSAASNPVTPRAHHTWFLNLEAIGASGGGTIIFLQAPEFLEQCTVSPGTSRQCQHSVLGGEDLVLQALADFDDDEIFWAGGCASVFGDNGDKCLVLWTEDGFSNVDAFFFVP